MRLQSPHRQRGVELRPHGRRIAEIARVAVVDAAGARAVDAAAIAAGIPSRALMQRAGAAAATEIALRFPELLADGVVIAAGPGNNGGDGWVVAAALHAAGVPVRVVECAEARTADARAERDSAIAAGVTATSDVDALVAGRERLAVDALLGTGLRADAPLVGAIAKAVADLHHLQRRGSTIVALDIPSGLDATSGHHVGAPRCALTLTFGTLKQGHLVARGLCGEIVVLDIGLGAHANGAGAPLATAQWFRASLPPIAAESHKGTRRRIAIVGGASGMAGAAILAARAALRSGVGLVKCVVAPESLRAVQEAEPAALAAAWPTDESSTRESIIDWADALLIGPGLGRAGARDLIERLLGAFTGPVVLDADALNAFAGSLTELRSLIGDRAALLTPHPAEMARLSGLDVDDVLEQRYTLPARIAGECGAAVLLKGVPTVVAAPNGDSIVVAEGTPILATGGAGDVLGGMAATLLAQGGAALTAGALAAFAHGRAASLVSQRAVRGYTLDDVLHALPDAWPLTEMPRRPPVLVELPAVGEPT